MTRRARHTRIYYAFVTSAPIDHDAPSTMTLYAATFADVVGFAADPITHDHDRAKTPARLVLVDAIELAWQRARYRGNDHLFLRADPVLVGQLFDAVQDVFEQANRPKYTKHQHAFAGLITCGRCGCAMTAERKKQRYVYYHCTGFKGRCGNTYIREEDLSARVEEVVRRIQIPADVADAIAETLRTSQAEKEQFHRTAVLRLQQRYLATQAKLDRAYEDRLAGEKSDELWSRKSQEWQRELEEVRRETSRHEKASEDLFGDRLEDSRTCEKRP